MLDFPRFLDHLFKFADYTKPTCAEAISEALHSMPGKPRDTRENYQYYSPFGQLIREGFAADFVPSTVGNLDVNSSPAIRVVVATDGRGLVTSENYGMASSSQVDWRSNSIFDSSGWLLAQCVNTSGGEPRDTQTSLVKPQLAREHNSR